MNNKLKLYCSLFVTVLILFMVFSFFHVTIPSSYVSYGDEKLEFMETPGEFYDVFDTVSHDGGHHYYSSVKTYHFDVNVMPKDRIQSSKDKALFSITNNQIYKMQMQSVRITTPSRQASTFFAILSFALPFVTFIVALYIIVLIFKTVKRIREGVIFASQVSRFIDIAGKLLVGLYLFQFIVSFVYSMYCINHIHLAQYYVVYKNDANIMLILTGLGLMIISQIILMGKDLKEEQDLTI